MILFSYQITFNNNISIIIIIIIIIILLIIIITIILYEGRAIPNFVDVEVQVKLILGECLMSTVF